MGISNWLQLTTAKWQGIISALPRLWDGYFNPAGFTHWLSDFPAHALAKPLTVAATDKTFWAAHYASEIAELKVSLAAGMTPENMVIQLVELQGLVGRYTLSPMSYEQGLQDCYRYMWRHLPHPQLYLQQLNQVRLDFRRALKQQPAFTQECLQGDLAYGLQQGRSNLLPIFQYYRTKLPITRYGQTLQQLQQVLGQNFQLTQTDHTLLLIVQCQRELQRLNNVRARANQAERHQASLWAELPFADELIASIAHEHATTASTGSAATSLLNAARRLAQFAYDYPGLALTYGLAGQAAAATFAPSYSLADLDGQNGFMLQGISADTHTGFSTSGVGDMDINGDGISDLIVGANWINNTVGAAYVVFGHQGNFPATLNLATLDGTNGFVLPGIKAGDYTGISTSGAGDINGDGVSDLIVGAYGVNNFAGAAYVVFGHQGSFPATLSLATLNSTNGFVLQGIDASDWTGASVSGVGDMNGDGVSDLVIGAFGVNNSAGAAYVVFGQTGSFPATLNLATLNGANGFVLQGIGAGARTGCSVSGAGDVNDDGASDLIVGAYGVNSGAGAAYVVFGHQGSFPATLNLASLNGANGFALQGTSAGDNAGISVRCAEDINGDGASDLIVGAYGVNNFAGAAYVVFGHQGSFPATLNLASLNGANGFALQGINVGSGTGVSVSGAGDINNDGISDLIVGDTDFNSGGAGAAYVVFGHEGSFPATLNLATLNGTNGLVLQGINAKDRTGRPVSDIGDINGDGSNDLIIGAHGANNFTGAAYVVFNVTKIATATTGSAVTTGSTSTLADNISSVDSTTDTSSASTSLGMTTTSTAGSVGTMSAISTFSSSATVTASTAASVATTSSLSSSSLSATTSTSDTTATAVTTDITTSATSTLSQPVTTTASTATLVTDTSFIGSSSLVASIATATTGTPEPITDTKELDDKTKAGIGVAAAVVGGTAIAGLAAFGIWKKCRKHPTVAGVVKRRSKGKSADIPLENVQVMAESSGTAAEISAAGPVKTLEINRAELVIGRLLGQGGFGKVYQGTWRNQAVAIKELVVRELSPEALASFRKEVSIMAQLSSEFIVRFYGAYFGNPYCMVMEYMPNGSLYATLHSSKPLDWLLRCGIALDIAKGLHYLHQANVLHRDVKSLNVLLDSRMGAKLSDFGLSKVKEESTTTLNTDGQRLVGSIPWMAPELLTRGNKYTAQADIYSYGMVLWEIAARQAPFAEARGNSGLIIQWILGNQLDPIPVDCPPPYAHIIQQCWQHQPEHRPTLEEIMQTIQTLQETGPEIEYHDDPNIQPLSEAFEEVADSSSLKP